MNRKYFATLMSITVLCIIFILIFLWKDTMAPIPKEQYIAHPHSPYKSSISAVGIVEASSENISIGIPVNRTIGKVYVKVGSKVNKGDVLFQLDDVDLKADLNARRIAYESSIANLQKLQSLPRAEDVASAEAALKSTLAEVAQAKSQYEMVQGLEDNRALSKEEIDRRRFKYEEAEAKKQLAQTDLNKIKAGTWQPDLIIARLEVEQAKANVERVKADIERTVIRSPIEGRVLQVRIHEGEIPPPDTSRVPAMIVGNTDVMHLRVSINQFNIPEYDPKASAVAFLQGNSNVSFPLKFVQIEPYIIPKQNLTNDIMEKVDTRVLQAIYSFSNDNHRVFVGQQMDVFIETNAKGE